MVRCYAGAAVQGKETHSNAMATDPVRLRTSETVTLQPVAAGCAARLVKSSPSDTSAGSGASLRSVPMSVLNVHPIAGDQARPTSQE